MDIKKLITLFLVIGMSFFAFSSQQAKEVARVKIKRGKATVISPDGTKAELKKDMWVKEGAIIKTEAKSFVKLSFIDKSSMNVGPKSELKIEKFSKKDAGVINVLTGKIRSKVTKDYLKMDKDKSKLFVRSKSAVMGIRGTEFIFTANKKAGSATAVLLEGSVVFNKISKGDNLRNLEAIVSKGRPIKPGQFSVVMKNASKPTVASKMSSKQLNSLAKNPEFKEAVKKVAKKLKSVVPPGLSGDIVMGGNENLEKEIKKVVKIKLKKEKAAPVDAEVAEQKKEESKGFVKGDDIKPADGSIVDIDSGAVIPLGADSTFDKNTGEWVSNSVGGVDDTGAYLPPEGFKMTETGDMLKVEEGGKVKKVVLEIKPLDQVKPLDAMPTVAYVPPADGPAPANAGGVEVVDGNAQNDAEAGADGPAAGDDAAPGDGDGPIEGPAPAGNADEGALAPPPLPTGSSTANQPNTIFVNTTTGTGAPPPPSTRTRVKVNVNRN